MVFSCSLRSLAATLMLGCALCACAGNPSPLAESATGIGEPYRLAAGDKLRVTVFGEEALTGEFSVTADGTVAFPLIGNVAATGETIEALQNKLRARLAEGYVRDPRVSVEVLGYRPFYILGEINKPGEYPFSVGLTLEQAVAMAGGYTYRANKRHLFIKRAREQDERSVDVRKRTVAVLPGDTIRIGERYF